MRPSITPESPQANVEGLAAIRAALDAMTTVSAHQHYTLVPLAGGVSSDIYRVDLPSGVSVCVKRALSRLKVAADWQAPVERNRWEVEWMRVVAGVVPWAVPKILGEDRDAQCFVMEYLSPERYPVWKSLLAGGVVDLIAAARVGDVLGRIHAATADREDIAARFATDAIFDAIRLEPYLIATAAAHPELAERLVALAATTRRHKRVLVHGDFSPKNILIGPDGPVILDAECAWYGDPAFDLAFVLNHLLLKGVWRPSQRAQYLDAFRTLAEAYFAHVSWEPGGVLDARTASLLPALTLARVDGKSPVEYLSDAGDKARIRGFARALLLDPQSTLMAIADRWALDMESLK